MKSLSEKSSIRRLHGRSLVQIIFQRNWKSMEYLLQLIFIEVNFVPHTFAFVLELWFERMTFCATAQLLIFSVLSVRLLFIIALEKRKGVINDCKHRERPIRRRSDYIIGFITPAIGPNKSKKLSRLIAPLHNIRGKVWMKNNIHGFTDR